MSVNKFQPHVLVLPEDDANSQLANGFLLDSHVPLNPQVQILEEAGGWTQVLDGFKRDHIAPMTRWSHRFMVLLIDFDSHLERLTAAKAEIPEHLSDRVFILGALTEPEALKQAHLGSFEEIGLAMAADCREGTHTIWGHELLRHNASELDRLRRSVLPILFPPN
jgi:hypothetical protein